MNNSQPASHQTCNDGIEWRGWFTVHERREWWIGFSWNHAFTLAKVIIKSLANVPWSSHTHTHTHLHTHGCHIRCYNLINTFRNDMAYLGHLTDSRQRVGSMAADGLSVWRLQIHRFGFIFVLFRDPESRVVSSLLEHPRIGFEIIVGQ